MTALAQFAPPARQTLIRAAILAGEAGQDRLTDEYLLLALAESQPLRRPVELGITADMVRAQVRLASPGRGDRELLATLGIDLDEVRRRAARATSLRRDDPALWQLRRSRIRPLRVTLSGPAAQLVLAESGRKVIEVASWASRRGNRPLASREDLLWGLLADASSESVAILRRCQADIAGLWSSVQRWHSSAS